MQILHSTDSSYIPGSSYGPQASQEWNPITQSWSAFKLSVGNSVKKIINEKKKWEEALSTDGRGPKQKKK